MIPPRVLNPVPNPYEIPEIVQGAKFLKKQTTSGRLVSLQTGPFVFSDKNIVEQTAEEPVRAFLPNSNLFWEIPSAGAYLSLFSEGFENLTRYLFKGFPYQGDWLDVCGVKTLLLPQVLPGSKYKLLGKLGKNFLMGNENAAAGERWVGGAADFPDRASLLEKLAQTGTGWKEKVFLERKTGGIHVELPPVSRILGDTENPISQQGASRISVASTFAGPGFWVWDESFTPGWHAWVDGKPAAVFRAYGLFMSVEVPQGSHRVDFRYEPSTFRLGLFLSLISLAMAGTLLVKVLQRDKKA
jgi:hypothetical protein